MYRLAAIAACAVLATGCSTIDEGTVSGSQSGVPVQKAMVSPILTTPDAVDDQTYAQPQVARVTHVALDLDLDFDAKMIGGIVTGFFEAYVEYFGLTEADLVAAISHHA